ncbi:hypothetical protein ABB27_13390 [Stenotrophomonas terrae]|uniref:Enoyl reductase (ER) domain-containing protein n=1 Tax=Stenotrophomonas terrae TaxID=405446 RepID=A0A0R0CM08_9GAMM|nr:NAD(P)H-quinone oxidoreductase [Stenotrophomonas terrae]KRG66593.1 hypothetical protein ABB27_13390 [Stenotrophomonas terrae]
MKIPGKMQLIQLSATGDADNLRIASGPTPRPRSGEVLIRVAAAGINRPDLLQRRGLYPQPPGASETLGLEIAGTVVKAAAGVQSPRVGEQVCALLAGGGYAEYATAPATQCLPIPARLSMLEASALPEAFFTVWSNLFMPGNLGADESILIHGGSSGIGTTAIAIAHAFGARVIVTAGSDEKCQACLRLGANHAINYRTQDFVQQVRSLQDGKGVDVVLDIIGGSYFARNLELLNMRGRIIQIGLQQGSEVMLPLLTLMQKRASVTGSTLRPRSIGEKAVIAQQLRQQVWPLIESGKIRPPLIDKVFPLAEAAQAHAWMERGAHIGKIVLQVAH